MFWIRLFSGIALLALTLLFIIPGGPLLLLVTAALSLAGMYELYRVLGIERKLPGWAGYASCLFYYVGLLFRSLGMEETASVFTDMRLLSVVLLLWLLAFYVLGYPRYHAKEIFGAFFGFYYVGVLLSFLYETRMMPQGQFIVWLIFLCSWGCDTSAYCIGSLFGKHKMSPLLSPKKSVEGATGGVLGAMLLTALYGSVLSENMGIGGKEILLLSLIAGVGALISMIGDLAASAVKRNYDIKDFGKLIPGHGGVLDRFDSVIITAPIIYYLALYVL